MCVYVCVHDHWWSLPTHVKKPFTIAVKTRSNFNVVCQFTSSITYNNKHFSWRKKHGDPHQVKQTKSPEFQMTNLWLALLQLEEESVQQSCMLSPAGAPVKCRPSSPDKEDMKWLDCQGPPRLKKTCKTLRAEHLCYKNQLRKREGYFVCGKKGTQISSEGYFQLLDKFIQKKYVLCLSKVGVVDVKFLCYLWVTNFQQYVWYTSTRVRASLLFAVNGLSRR